jgi:hypothetical protein
VVTTSPYAILESLVGGLWVAPVAPEKDGVPALTIELRFAWAANQQGVRFDSSFVRAGKISPYTSGMYFWNAARHQLGMLYTDSGPSLAEGLITIEEGNVLVHDLTITDATGKAEPVQVRLTKVSADAFTNDIYVKKNGAWEKFVAVRYERHG